MPHIMDLLQVAEVYWWLRPCLTTIIFYITVIVNNITTINAVTGSREGCMD